MRRAFVILLVLLSVTSGGRVAADGKYFARYEFERDPTVPSQRAVLRWKDNIQTLVVESVVESGSEEVGWVLPLPAEPTDIEAVTPGTIETLQILLQPEIRSGQNLKVWNVLLGTIFLIIVCWSVDSVLGRKMPNWGWLVLIVLLLLSCTALLLPAIGTARGVESIPSLTTLQSKRVGSFDVNIITAMEASDIQAWLDDNGFRCPDEALSVLDAYVKDEWVFATAKIAHDATRPMSPHPIRFAFPSEKPIYPMRLTGITDQPLQLDLYIIGDETAQIDSMERWWSAPFEERRIDAIEEYQINGFGEMDSKFSIGHPHVAALMFDGCVLSHHHGVLDPDEMRDDLEIRWGGDPRFRKTIHSRAGAVHTRARGD